MDAQNSRSRIFISRHLGLGKRMTNRCHGKKDSRILGSGESNHWTSSPASLPNSTPATTKITAQPPLEQLSKMEKIRLRTGEIRERREKKREGSLVAWSCSLSLGRLVSCLCLRGQEWKRLRERFAKESCGAVKSFPLGFPTLLVSTYLWKRWDSLICWCQGSRRRVTQLEQPML